jgi:predicted TIM-barrel fold metal-dependent hydrolase
VLVQPSFLGTDCSYLLAALAQEPQRLRGVVVIDPASDSAKLDALQRVGVVGIRLNLFDLPNPDFTRADWQQTLAAIARLDWHVEVHVEAQRLEEVVPPLLDKGINVVVDHFGRPDPALGIADPGFRYLLTLGFTRQVWVKLSGAYRIGRGPQGEVTAIAAMPLLKAAFGTDRRVWGSDWPHTQFEQAQDYARAVTLLRALLPDPQERRAVLVDTAAALFKFVERARNG